MRESTVLKISFCQKALKIRSIPSEVTAAIRSELGKKHKAFISIPSETHFAKLWILLIIFIEVLIAI